MSTQERNRLINYEDFYTQRTKEREVTDEGKEVIRRYTSEDGWWCTRINLELATDLIPVEPPEHHLFVKQLKCCIGWQTPKHKGLVYRGALHSPMEVHHNIIPILHT